MPRILAILVVQTIPAVALTAVVNADGKLDDDYFAAVSVSYDDIVRMVVH